MKTEHVVAGEKQLTGLALVGLQSMHSQLGQVHQPVGCPAGNAEKAGSSDCCWWFTAG